MVLSKKQDLEYPECFKTHADCLKCSGFGQECTRIINEIDYERYIEENQINTGCD